VERRPIHIVLALLLSILPACSRPAPEQTDVEPSVPVITEPVRLGTVRGTVSATGIVTTLPGATYSVIAHQPARIAEITKTTGDEVKSGEVLVRFEFTWLRAETAVNAAAMKAAELRLRQARLAQSRVQSLLSKGAASQREMDDADREVTLAEGELTTASASMASTEARGQDTTIRAPFNGTVVERLHQPGDFVRPEESDPILRLIDPKQVQVSATVAATDIVRFALGATARAIGPATATAELLRVVSRPVPEAGATTVTVMLAFDSPTELTPGTQVGIEIDAEQRSNVPLVPAIAVLKDSANNTFVMVAAGSIAQRRPVVTGLEETQNIEILSGVKAGELIITQGHSSLRDGTPITVTAP
jgi:RND family efflux transporter MFP subunit